MLLKQYLNLLLGSPNKLSYFDHIDAKTLNSVQYGNAKCQRLEIDIPKDHLDIKLHVDGSLISFTIIRPVVPDGDTISYISS